jgi:hypothetical protein
VLEKDLHAEHYDERGKCPTDIRQCIIRNYQWVAGHIVTVRVDEGYYKRGQSDIACSKV